MHRQLVSVEQTDVNKAGVGALIMLSGERAKRLQIFAKLHQIKYFSKLSAFEIFSAIARKPYRSK